ncbi:MAG: hypothetical protein QOG45_1888 [Chloroflexota bacterium]|nr:hypothetical protein [Chloroflexota bacterium]
MRISMLRWAAGLSAAALLLLGEGPAASAEVMPPGAPDPGQLALPGAAIDDVLPGLTTGQDIVVTPAPPGSASASALQVNPLNTCVGCSSASAGNGSARSRAIALRLLGNDIAGGELTGDGTNSGALLAIPANPLLALALADWRVSNATGPTSTAHSRAALADLVLGPNGPQGGGVLTVAVLEATSDASGATLASSGTGVNNGVDLNLENGALVLILLHSEASSNNTGSAYLVGINGQQIGSSQQTGGIPITVPGVVGVVLLQVNASGGSASSKVGTAGDLLGQQGQTAGILTADAVAGTGVTAPPPPTLPATGGGALPGGAALGVPSAGVALGLSGLLLLMGGATVLALTLRRRRA